MIPLPELIQNDKTFARFFRTTPHLYPIQIEKGREPWRLWVKSTPNSAWRTKNVQSYSNAVGYVLDRLDDLYDFAVQSRARAYGPPDRVVRLTQGGKPIPGPEGLRRTPWRPSPDLIREYGPHDWCFQCRRPTVWGYYEAHPAFRGTSLQGFAGNAVRRCALCGISHSYNRTTR